MSKLVAAAVAITFAAACSPSQIEDRTGGSVTLWSNARFRFAVVGDFGTGGGAQAAVARQMCRIRRKAPFAHVVTTGDNLYPYGSESFIKEKFLRPYSCLFDRGVQFHSSLGNHDVSRDGGEAELNEAAFGMPRRNFVFRRRGVRFVVWDSNTANRRWLRRATRTREGDRWTVVAFHHPVYSVGVHGSTPGMRPGLPRLFRRRGVDLVLNGHDHLYMATRPLRRIRYVVTGGGGAPLYSCGEASFVAKCKELHHFVVVEVGASALRVRAIGAGGGLLHDFKTRGVR